MFKFPKSFIVPGTYIQSVIHPIRVFKDYSRFSRFSEEFDEPWRNKYAIKCNRMVDHHFPHPELGERAYGLIYNLSEFLWKLKVWKP